MNVDKEILLKRIKSQDIPEANAKAFYDWRPISSMTGTLTEQHLVDANYFSGMVFNLFTDPLKYFVDSDPSLIKASSMSCVSVGISHVAKALNGAGVFDGECVLVVLGSSEIENWTVFIDLSSDCPTSSEKNKSRILFSNRNSLSNSSGFIVGLNGANSLFYESIDDDGKRSVRTCYRPLGEQALISISKSKDTNTISLNVFDPVYNKLYSKSFETKEKQNSYSFSIGGLETEDLQQNAEYAGFSGDINNFVLIDKYMSSGEISSISEAFFLTAYAEQHYEDIETVVTMPGSFKEIQVRDGFTTTGYAYQPKEMAHIGSNQSTTIFEQVPVKEAAYKTITQYVKGEGTVLKKVRTLIPETKTYDKNHSKTYSEKCLLLDSDEDKTKTVEIYSFSEIQSNLNKKATFNTGDNTFRISKDYSTEINFNIYLNGKIQERDVDYQISGTTITKLQGNYGELDEVVYDIASSSIVGIDFNEYSGDVYWYGYQNKDVYLNGKKLVYGVDYEEFLSTFLVLHASGLSAGRVLFVDRNASITDTNNSSNKYVHCQSFNIISEKVWIDGVRSLEGPRYSLTCVCDLNNSDNTAETNTALVYNNEGTFFNIY